MDSRRKGFRSRRVAPDLLKPPSPVACGEEVGRAHKGFRRAVDRQSPPPAARAEQRRSSREGFQRTDIPTPSPQVVCPAATSLRNESFRNSDLTQSAVCAKETKPPDEGFRKPYLRPTSETAGGGASTAAPQLEQFGTADSRHVSVFRSPLPFSLSFTAVHRFSPDFRMGPKSKSTPVGRQQRQRRDDQAEPIRCVDGKYKVLDFSVFKPLAEWLDYARTHQEEMEFVERLSLRPYLEDNT